MVKQCPLLGVKQTLLQLTSMSAYDPKRTSAITRDPSSHKRLDYFLLGRLRFDDDVASRRFAHLVSDGLPLK